MYPDVIIILFVLCGVAFWTWIDADLDSELNGEVYNDRTDNCDENPAEDTNDVV
jgi:hypothetical protein